MSTRILRQIRIVYEVTIALPRRPPPFIDRPYNQALAAATITRGVNARHICSELAIGGLGIGSLIAFNAASQRGARPRLVCSRVPVTLMTLRREGRALKC